MVKWANFLVSKQKWLNGTKTIESFIVHTDNGNTVGPGYEHDRNWVVQQLRLGHTFCCIHRTESNSWQKGSSLVLHANGSLQWDDRLPLIKTKRKSFISYYHKDDQDHKEKFESLSDDLIVNKSVKDGDIDGDNEDEYIKQLIQKGYLKDTTVLIVLLGAKTKCRKHVDWEISGALNLKIGGSYAGLLGLKLPSHPDYGKGKHQYANLPGRLADNSKSGYAVIRDYTTDRVKLQEYIELAYKNRTSQEKNRDNSRSQLKINTCS